LWSARLRSGRLGSHPEGESAEQLERMMNKVDKAAARAPTAGIRFNVGRPL